MIKNIILGIFGLITFVLLTLTLLMLYLGWGALKQPPAHGLIIEKYYVCPSKKALHGGIFGKGPSKQFFASGRPAWCWRWEWKEIERAEFLRLASKWYAVDWDAEGEWWHPQR